MMVPIRGGSMFVIEDFIEQCRGALAETEPAVATRELLARALGHPGDVAAAFDPPVRAELSPLYRGPDLTILKVIWAPGMRLPPHDHRMWAVIGIYGGQEDNHFFRRAGAGLAPSGGKSIRERDTLALGDDVIHAVTNPSAGTFTGSIHIYGGDFFSRPRSLWDPETMEEEPATGVRMQSLFDQANQAGRPE